MGYCNDTRMFYRHYMIDSEHDYVVTVIPIYGDPILMISVQDDVQYSNIDDDDTYDFINDDFN